ncbi:DUF6531 domain-containing protein [Diaphorobacter aerolatus]|uniref:RHS repeat protein n=1 Tax=Diaphorobacter aerolatus TaxID=1288495 RepID=A0A7H0GLF8_9BURK|nr:DUF6531 domain-containing protein [Diaphorobacter aerolatus]QNP49124.1 hypothetical protein H9K75_02980 [Diaphorobacter aerolatus]
MTGLPAARQTDMTLKGGPITQGSRTVYIGTSGGVACSTCPRGVSDGNPVNAMLGAKVQTNEIDVALPGPLPFVVSRDYSSYQTDTPAPVGLLGPGWWLPDEVSLQQSATQLTLNDSKGRSIRFDPLSAGMAAFSRSENLWIVRGGLECLDEIPELPMARLNMAWLALHLDDRRNASLFFVTNDALGPWWIFGPQPPQAEIDNTRLHLLGTADRFGHVKKIARNAAGWMNAVQDGVGRQYRLELKQLAHIANDGLKGWGADSGMRLMAVHLTYDPQDTDPHGAQPLPQLLVRYEYNPRGELVAVYGRDGSLQRSFQYHTELPGRMVAHAYAGREPVTYAYNETGKVVGQHRPGSLSYRFDYHPDSATVTDSLGRRKTYHFEGQAGLRRVVRIEQADGSTTQSRFDASGRLTASIDALGRETSFELDVATGALLSVTLPDGSQSRWDYNAQGQMVQSRSASGMTTRFVYDDQGRTASTSDALGNTTRYVYPDERSAQPSVVQDARGGEKHLTWNTAEQLIRYSDCSGSTTRYRYDRWGQLISTQGEEGSGFANEYDVQGRIVAHTNAARQTTRYDYSAAGDLMAVTGPDGNTIRFERDPLGQMLVYHYGGLTQHYEYDHAGRLIRLTNENGAHTTFEYDLMDRLTRQVNFDKRTQSYTFNAAGEVTTSRDEGLTHRFTYDKAGRLLTRETGLYESQNQIRSGGQREDEVVEAVIQSTLHFQYGEGGVMAKAWHHTEIGSNRISVEFLRDALGRVTEEIQQISDAQGNEVWKHSVERQFDELGTETRTTYEGLPSIEWQTYGSGHLHGVVLGGKTLIDFERDKLHRETRRTFGEVQISRTYDNLSRLSHLEAHSPLIGEDQTLHRVHHYDLAGQLTQIETANGLHQYGYDKAGRLISAVQPGFELQHYKFDPAGNRLFENQQAHLPVDQWEETVRQHLKDRDFNLLGDVNASQSNHTEPRWMDNRILDDGEFRYGYDAWGNLRRKHRAKNNEQHHYIYDSSHRLVRYGFESDDAVRGANYHYDPFGRRMVKQVQQGDGDGKLVGDVETTYFGWDGDRLVLTEKDRRQVFTIYEPDTFVPMIRLEGDKIGQKKKLAQKLKEQHDISMDTQTLAMLGDIETELKKSRFKKIQLQGMKPIDMQSMALKELVLKDADTNQWQLHLYRCDHLGSPLDLITQRNAIEWRVETNANGIVTQDSDTTLLQPLDFRDNSTMRKVD